MLKLVLVPCLALAALSFACLATAPQPGAPASGPAVDKADTEPSVLPKPLPGDGRVLSTRSSVKVTAFKFTGNTAFSSEQLCQVAHKALCVASPSFG